MKAGCIIQARTSSTRLPGKVLKALPYSSNANILQQVIRRVKIAANITDVIIATTLDQDDEAIVDIALKEEVKFYRGSKDNVLSRYYEAAKTYDLDIVIRVTSDCPCIDPVLISRGIDIFLNEKPDYLSNTLKRTFPHGVDYEIMTFQALEQAYANATLDFEKEHVTPYIYRSHPDRFKIMGIEAEPDQYSPDIRAVVDTPADYSALCTVYDYLYNPDELFEVKDLIALYEAKPWLHMINQDVVQKKIFDTLEEELQESVKILKLQSLDRASEFLDKYIQTTLN
jgi:spore coat polysaccharide biosynthesis protein SpsF